MSLSSFLSYFLISSILQGVRGSTVCSDGHIVANSACCALFPVLTDVQSVFEIPTCSSVGRSILHLAFHDAMGFSLSAGGGGGADGSIITFDNIEMSFSSNTETVFEQTIGVLKPISAKHNISDGDLLHFAAAVSIASCPGAPRVPFKFGRPRAIGAASPLFGTPQPSDNVTSILARFQDVGFSSTEVVSLLSAHSIAGSHTIDVGAIGHPLDSSPEVFDTQIFLEVLLPGLLYPGNGSNVGEAMSPIAGEIRLESDLLIARDSRTACAWQSLVGNQPLMVANFQAAMAKLSLVGQNQAALVDCSDTIPVPAGLPPTATLHFPAGFNSDSLQTSCVTEFLVIPTSLGAPPTVAIADCYGSQSRCWEYSETATGPSTPTPSAIINVESSILKVFFAVNDFDNSIIIFLSSGETFTAALAIHTAAMNFLSTINAAIVSAQAVILPVSEINAQTIFTQIQGVEPVLAKSLQRLVSLKSVFQAISSSLPTTFGQDLKSLKSAISLIEAAILRIAPADLIAQASLVKAAIDSALATAIAAYPA